MKFPLKKEQLLIEYLLSSADTFAIVASMLRPDYFDPEHRFAIEFVLKYYDDYNSLPSFDQVNAEAELGFEPKEVTKDKIEYCSKEIEKFCRKQALTRAVLQAAKIIQEDGDEGKIEKLVQEAMLVSIDKDLGLEYNKNVKERLERLASDHKTQSTGWTLVDELLYGGLRRKEMLLLSANSGGGKSITLSNLAINFAQAGLKVLYISLELDEDVIGLRFDIMSTGMGGDSWKHSIDEIAVTVENLPYDIFVKQMPSGANANDIKAYLKEFELKYGCLPDLLIVDYLDLMSPVQRVDPGDVFSKDKYVSEELRNIGVIYDMFVATASQLNRSAVGVTELNHSHIAGGISKINTTDVYIQIVMTEAMKAAGEMSFVFGKTRNSDGVGKTAHLSWINKFLRIEDRKDEDGNSSLTFNSRSDKSQTQNNKPRKNSAPLDFDLEKGTINDLLDVFDD